MTLQVYLWQLQNAFHYKRIQETTHPNTIIIKDNQTVEKKCTKQNHT